MAPQDSFIDEDDDTCPLCVEEFDLSDKNFRPCPCGYQVCQFCFNNIKNNMNGLCPACRRPYDEKTIEWKVVTPEEIAQFKANIQKNAKKKAEQRQKEAQKREVESLNRKHLSGLRVVQKNLVYVVGLQPGIREDELLQTLRGEKFFGQYGKIIKIVVSKAKQGEAGPNGSSLGVYVTFAKKEDAARCIAAVNGSENGGRTLRAQLGTTKYCSAYLRNETCTNKQCMFLHEPGDNDDSYSRQDLSSINSVHTQRPLPSMASSSGSSSRQAQAPIQQVQPVAAAAQPMTREGSKDGSDSGDGSALPSSASWAKQRSRRGSHATSGAASSPAISQSMPATTETVEERRESTPDHQEPEIVNITTSSGLPPSSQPQRLESDSPLAGVLRSLNPTALFLSPTNANNETSESATFPPLFDSRGGEKRRAMREQQEEARLHIEQESQADMRSVPETLDEEEPESGSLQLGGEPEDRDSGREGSLPQGFHGQRRPSTQLPIQRSSNGGPFGPNLGQNFPQNLGNLSSINGRTLTPLQQQQLLLLKSNQPQSSFADQFPSGVGQSTLFQQQGHNRQSSRYSFANDSSSASSIVKPSANAKFLAQQSSMMPSGSHTQPGNQFYGSSMPGPPPGLKSSGTPPISGMFGQNHAFGGSMTGSSLFGAKDNSNELLRDMVRGRGAAGSSQVHDAGKLDLADPSILQARMQHQQQSNAGVGQGLFGGQAQDEQDIPFLAEASSNVDALVSDSMSDDMGFAAMDPFGFGVQSSTPPVPPGISPPSFPLPNGPSEPILLDTVKAPSRIVPTSAPFTPSRPPPSQTLVGPPMDNMSGPPTPTQGISSTRIHELSTAQAKQDVKAFAGISGLSKTIISQGPQAKLQSEDFPALERSKAKSTSVTSPAKLTPTVKATSGAANAKKPASTLSSNVSASQPPIRQAEKKSLPSVLNILTSPSKPEIAEKTVTASSSFPPLPPSTPSVSSHPTLPRPTTAGVKSTKTLPTSKIETPIATPSSTSSAFPSNYYATRQPSLASISKLERSGTPTSEIISDNASITSASISRANSPPPSKIGSAPVRVNTKSMQKKQRKEIQKENLKQELEAAATKPEPEAEIGPIMGRKKKQKKERTGSSAAGGSTPAASRPPSPGPGTASIREEITVEVSEQQDTASEKPQLEKATNNLTKQTSDNKNKGKAKVQRPPSPEPVSAVTETHEEPTEKPIPTPASIFQELISSGAIEDIANLNFLKLPNSSGRHQDPQSDLQNAIPKLTITPEDRAALLAGKLVRKNVDGPNRIMLTPNGDCVRNLTPEEEQRYLNLQASIAKENGPAAFFSAKHHTTNGFALVGGRAVPNGPPAFFPQSASAIDPVSKIQRDEALSYINQYVLPSLHTNSQLEKALNANALDAEMMRSSDSAAWSSWGNDPAGLSRPETDSGFNATHEGILATGLQNMTAHFAIGRDIDRGQPLGNVSMLSLTDAESAMHMARKETEGLEKRLIALLKRNKRVLVGSGH